MAFVRGLFRVYSWIFEAILCLMAIGVGIITLISKNENLKIGWLPWSGDTLPIWLIALGVLGLLLVLLSMFETLRVSLFLFSLAVFVLLVKGFFYGFGYSFENGAQARNALLLVSGALMATVGSWPTAPPNKFRRR